MEPSISGMTMQVVEQFDGYEENPVDVDQSLDQILDMEGEPYVRLREFIKSNQQFPASLVKVNCLYNSLGIAKDQRFSISKAELLDEVLKNQISSEAEEVLKYMAKRLSEECQNNKVKDFGEDVIRSQLTDATLSPQANKEFVRKFALGTNLSYEIYLKMLQKMAGCALMDIYDVDDFLAALVIKYQGFDRYATYQALKNHYKAVKSLQPVKYGAKTLDVLDIKKKIESIYKNAVADSVDHLEDVVKQKILEHKAMVASNRTRTAVADRDKMLATINGTLQGSGHSMVKLAKSFAKGQNHLHTKFRIVFDPAVFEYLPAGTEFVVEDGVEPVAFITMEDVALNANQRKRKSVDVDVEAYVAETSGKMIYAKKKTIKIDKELPEGIKYVINPYDISFDGVEVQVFYDPASFEEVADLRLQADLEKSKNKVELMIPVLEVPQDYIAIVPVEGGKDSVPVKKKYQEVQKATTNIWSCDQFGVVSVGVENEIKKFGDVTRGTLRVILDKPGVIRKGTQFEYKDKKGTYFYEATEDVKLGVIDAQAYFEASVDRVLKTKTGDLSFEPAKGIQRVTTSHRYEVPHSLFYYFRLLALGRAGESQFNDDRYKDFPPIGEWLLKAELPEDIETTKTITRNDILTLCFLDYALDNDSSNEDRYEDFKDIADLKLSACGFDEFYITNPYDRFLAFLLLHTADDDILNTYSLIWQIALQQRGLR